MPSARNAGESAIRVAAEQAVEVEAENWGLCSATLVRGVAGEWEDESWRVGSWKLRTGEFLAQLEYVEQCVELQALKLATL